jgi:hypothetical protein
MTATSLKVQDVICASKSSSKASFDDRHTGNARLRVLVQMHIDAYRQGDQAVRIKTVMSIVDIVQAYGGRFLVFEDDSWQIADKALACATGKIIKWRRQQQWVLLCVIRDFALTLVYLLFAVHLYLRKESNKIAKRTRLQILSSLKTLSISNTQSTWHSSTNQQEDERSADKVWQTPTVLLRPQFCMAAQFNTV